MDWKILKFQEINTIPKIFFCKICLQLKPQMGLNPYKQIYCIECMDIAQIEKRKPMHMFTLYDYSTTICSICKKRKTLPAYQKHFLKCQAWHSMDYIKEIYNLNYGQVIKCSCSDSNHSKLCGICYKLLCNQCMNNHKNCEKQNFINEVALCKNDACQKNLKQGELVEHGLQCDLRIRHCYRCLKWTGIQRDYDLHAYYCYRWSKQVAAKISFNRSQILPKLSFQNDSIQYQKAQIKRSQNQIVKKLKLLEHL